jgi:hypothetical protein
MADNIYGTPSNHIYIYIKKSSLCRFIIKLMYLEIIFFRFIVNLMYLENVII